MNRYPRETTEYVKFEQIVYEGVPQNDFQYALTQGLERPEIWANPVEVSGVKAFQLDGSMEPGYWKVWIKTSAGVVLFVERFELT